ncbi:MAG: hypothetical protein V3W10_10115, partial [candidate division NC10 bacterium]
YLLNGASVTTGELLQTMEKVTGFRRRPWQVGRGVALALGTGMEWCGRLSGHRPRFCREMARTILHGGRYDNSKAERELEISFTPLHEMVTRTVAWYAQAGHVKHLLPGLASEKI